MSLSFLSAVRRFPLFLPAAKLAAAALVAMVVAGPAGAQSITAPGLVGPSACAGPGETTDPLSGSIRSVRADSADIEIVAYSNLYSDLRGKAGDGGPSQFAIHYRVRNAKTNSVIFTSQRLVRIGSSTQNLGRYLRTLSSLSAKTPYVFEVYTSSGGLENSPLLRRCFMTGGTYTPTNTTFPGSTGCFSISPRTPQDVRNCLCGRGNTGTVGTQSYNYTSLRPAWGCAN